jgi:hypothetical protein
MKLSRDQIKQKLKSLWNYPDFTIESELNQLFSMDDELQSSFDLFVQTDEFPEKPKIFGLSPADIHKAYPFRPPAVFTLLDWIRQSPEEAMQMLIKEYNKPLPATLDVTALNEWYKSHNEEKSS